MRKFNEALMPNRADYSFADFKSHKLYRMFIDRAKGVYRTTPMNVKDLSDNPKDELFSKTAAFGPTCAILTAAYNFLVKHVYEDEFSARVPWHRALPFMPALQKADDTRCISSFTILCHHIACNLFSLQDASFAYDMFFKWLNFSVTIQYETETLPAPTVFRRLVMLNSTYDYERNQSVEYEGNWKQEVVTMAKASGVRFGVRQDEIVLDKMIDDPSAEAMARRWAIFTQPVHFIIACFMRRCPDNAVARDQTFFQENINAFKNKINIKTQFIGDIKTLALGSSVTRLLNELTTTRAETLPPGTPQQDLTNVSITLSPAGAATAFTDTLAAQELVPLVDAPPPAPADAPAADAPAPAAGAPAPAFVPPPSGAPAEEYAWQAIDDSEDLLAGMEEPPSPGAVGALRAGADDLALPPLGNLPDGDLWDGMVIEDEFY